MNAVAVPLAAPRRRPIVPSPLFASLLFVFVEVMFFCSLLSAFFVIRRGRDFSGMPGLLHLPTAAAGFNLGVLLLSSAVLTLAVRALSRPETRVSGLAHLFRATVLATFFALFQLALTIQLVQQGLTMTSSIFGGCYYLLAGAHELHALFGAGLLVALYRSTAKALAAGGTKTAAAFDVAPLKALFVFWLFVTGIWPFFYAQLYF